MYCKNCGKEVNEKAEICTSCGVRPLTEKKFCQECGSETKENQEICVKCGVRLISDKKNEDRNNELTNQVGDKDWTTTLLLAFFLGVFGVHRFYTGYTMIGFVQLLTFGGCGIWYVIDIITILRGKYKDSDNLLLSK